MRLRRAFADDSGVTLVESLVVIALISVVGTVVMTGLVRGMSATAQTTNRLDGLAALQASVDRMTRELRAAEPLQFADSSGTTAVANVYRSNFTQHLRYTYRYCPAQGRVVVRREGPAPAPTGAVASIDCASTTLPPLITGVANGNVASGGIPMFEYLNSSLSPALTAPQVQHIRVTVRRSIATSPALTCNPATDRNCLEVQTIVRVRNAP